MHPYSGTDSGFQVGGRSISQKKKKKKILLVLTNYQPRHIHKIIIS